jgi:predicted nuclease with TOPRIM domain
MNSNFNQKIEEKIQKMNDSTMGARQFERRLIVLNYAVQSLSQFSISDVQKEALDASNSVIRAYLLDLISLGYVERVTVWTYMATEKSKQLFGVK